MNKFLSSKTKLNTSKKDFIVDQLLNDIDKGTLKRNEQLPNRKLLAKRFAVDPKTIDRAILQLVECKVLETVSRKGTYVKEVALLSSNNLYGNFFSGTARAELSLTHANNMYVQMGTTELNPYFFLQHCMKQIGRLTIRLIQQSIDSWKGYERAQAQLNDSIRNNLSMREGKCYVKKNFMLLSGRYAALRLIAKQLICPADIVVMAFPAVLPPTIFEELGAEVWGINRSSKGIRAAELKYLQEQANKTNRRIALLYTNLQLDYTAGNLEKMKQEMAALLVTSERFKISIIEEFEDHELTYQLMPTFADVATRTLGHVISIRSYSKLLAMYNELRLILAPANFIDRLSKQDKLEVNYGFLYHVLAIMLLEDKIFMRVAEPITNNFKVHLDRLLKQCDEALGPWIDIATPISGISFWISAKRGHMLYVPMQKIKNLKLQITCNMQQTTSLVKTENLLLGFGNGDTKELKQALLMIGNETAKHDQN